MKSSSPPSPYLSQYMDSLDWKNNREPQGQFPLSFYISILFVILVLFPILSLISNLVR